MRKAAIHSITAPGPAVEDLAADAGYKKRAPRPSNKDDVDIKDEEGDEPKIHPLVEVAMSDKLANSDPKITPPEFLLPPKTTGDAVSLKRLTALSNVADRSTGASAKSDADVIPAKGGDAHERTERQSVGAHRSISSLEQAKTAAFAKAEILASLFQFNLSKTAAERLSAVLVKAALGVGYGNTAQLGQAVPRTAQGTRSATTTSVNTTDHVGTKKLDGTSIVGNKPPLVNTPAVNVLMNRPVGAWLGTGGSTLGKAGALVEVVKSGMSKQAVLDFLRVSPDKKAALLTLGRLHKASEQERAWAKLAGLLRTYELTNSDGKGVMPSGPEGPVPTVMTRDKTQFATEWCNRLDPFSRKVPLARVMGRRKGNL